MSKKHVGELKTIETIVHLAQDMKLLNKPGNNILILLNMEFVVLAFFI